MTSGEPGALVLKAPGTNCDFESADALARAGARPEIVTVHELLERPERIFESRILCVPGGFAHGDDIAAARILANQCRLLLGEALLRFVNDEGGFVLGICNGFQALVKLGLLPRTDTSRIRQQASIVHNDSGKYECRWVRMRIEPSACGFLEAGTIWEMPVGHGEGKFIPAADFDVEGSGLVTLRYVDETGQPTQEYPANPNGSIGAVAGLCDPTGRVLGLMPHPDRAYLPQHHPQSTRREVSEQAMAGARFFRSLVEEAGR